MATQPNDRTGTSSGLYNDTGTTGFGAGTQRVSDSLGTGGNTGDARGVASEVQEKAEELMSRAGETARTRIDDGKQRAARELGSVASALRQCGTDMNTEQGLLTPYVNRVADQVERFSTFIDTHSPEELARDVESFARRNPAVFLGGCFAIGMMAARFLKSSRPELPVRYGYQQNTLNDAGYMSTMSPTGYGDGRSYGGAVGSTGGTVDSTGSYGGTAGSTGAFDAAAGRTRDR